MSTYFDERGKFFTMVISKEAVPVVVQTTTHRIRGYVHVKPGERLKDELNSEEPFFAITDGEVMDMNGSSLYHSDFLAINRQQIVWLLPEDQLKPNS